MPEVIIDGVRYIPAAEVVVNSDDVAKALYRECWGDLEMDDKDLDRLWVIVTDDRHEGGHSPTLRQFIDKLVL